MKKKKMWRYYCDFCRKVGGGLPAMKKHERGCTMNPDRYCAMHEHCGVEQLPMTELVAVFRRPGAGSIVDNYLDFSGALSDLRTMTGNCPACILAAIRQSKVMCRADNEAAVGIFGVTLNFDFKQECSIFWAQVNGSVPAEHRDTLTEASAALVLEAVANGLPMSKASGMLLELQNINRKIQAGTTEGRVIS